MIRCRTLIGVVLVLVGLCSDRVESAGAGATLGRVKTYLDSVKAIDTHSHLRGFDYFAEMSAKGSGATLASLWSGSYLNWIAPVPAWQAGTPLDAWWPRAQAVFADVRATSVYRYMLPAFRDLYGVDFGGILPHVLINVAMSADGKLAPASRRFTPFSSRHDQSLLRRLRAGADAVMCGARTLDSGPVTLGPGGKFYERLRLRHGLTQYNLRVIASGAGSINPHAEVFKHHHSPIIILTTARAGARRLTRLEGLADDVKICGNEEIDFREALRWLRLKWRVRSLVCEGGGELNWALIRAGVVREIYVTICPVLIGGDRAPTLADGEGIRQLASATRLRLKSFRPVGSELFLRYQTTGCP